MLTPTFTLPSRGRGFKLIAHIIPLPRRERGRVRGRLEILKEKR